MLQLLLFLGAVWVLYLAYTKSTLAKRRSIAEKTLREMRETSKALDIEETIAKEAKTITKRETKLKGNKE